MTQALSGLNEIAFTTIMWLLPSLLLCCVVVCRRHRVILCMRHCCGCHAHLCPASSLGKAQHCCFVCNCSCSICRLPARPTPSLGPSTPNPNGLRTFAHQVLLPTHTPRLEYRTAHSPRPLPEPETMEDWRPHPPKRPCLLRKTRWNSQCLPRQN